MATWFIDFDDVTDYTDHFTSRRYTANTVELVNDDGQQTLHVLAGTSPTTFNPLFFSFDTAGTSVVDFEVVCLIKPVHNTYNTNTVDYSFLAIAGRWDNDAARSVAYNLGLKDAAGSGPASIKTDRHFSSNANGSTTYEDPEVSTVDHWDYLWMRLRVEDGTSPNVNVYRKLWQADELEPASWTCSYEGTLSDINAYYGLSGYLGFGSRGNTAEYYIKKIGFASAGDTAPMTGSDPTPKVRYKTVRKAIGYV